jgi:hypothetical protein
MNVPREALKNETIFQLAGDWKTDLANLFRKEVQLAKTEMSEKVSCFGRNAVYMAIGGVLALMAVLILLFSLGAIIAMALRSAGLSIGMSYFVSYIGLALILGGVGYGLISKGLHAFTSTSVAPEKTLETIRELKGEPVVAHNKTIKVEEKKEKKESSSAIKHQVDDTRERVEDEMAEIKARLRPKHMCKTAWAMTKEHPIRILAVAVATGLSSALLIRHRMHARA